MVIFFIIYICCLALCVYVCVPAISFESHSSVADKLANLLSIKQMSGFVLHSSTYPSRDPAHICPYGRLSWRFGLEQLASPTAARLLKINFHILPTDLIDLKMNFSG